MYDYDAHRRVGLKGANPGLHSGVHSHNSPLSQASSSLLTQPSPELLYRYGGVGGGGGGGGRVGLGGQQTPQTAPAPLLPADSAAAPQPQGWWWRRMLPPPQLLYVLAAVTLLIWAFPCILPLYDTVDIDLTYYRAYEDEPASYCTISRKLTAYRKCQQDLLTAGYLAADNPAAYLHNGVDAAVLREDATYAIKATQRFPMLGTALERELFNKALELNFKAGVMVKGARLRMTAAPSLLQPRLLAALSWGTFLLLVRSALYFLCKMVLAPAVLCFALFRCGIAYRRGEREKVLYRDFVHARLAEAIAYVPTLHSQLQKKFPSFNMTLPAFERMLSQDPQIARLTTNNRQDPYEYVVYLSQKTFAHSRGPSVEPVR